jgi:sugar O-acyltransferase (sialic acid O-acetyltransferase NeuD family)
LIILGAGNVARELVDLIADINRHRSLEGGIEFSILCFAEDVPNHRAELGPNANVISSKEVLRLDRSRVRLVCAAGDPARARWIAAYEAAGFEFARVIHPAVTLSDRAVVGDGTIIYPGCFVSCGVKIGRHVLVQANCSVMHDVEIGNFCTLCPGVHLGGYAKVGERSFIGIGTAVVDRVAIGQNTTVGAGTTVIADLPSDVVAVGSPAHVIKTKQTAEHA